MVEEALPPKKGDAVPPAHWDEKEKEGGKGEEKKKKKKERK